MLVKPLKLPPCTCAATDSALICGRFKLVGVSGVSCMIGIKGFSNVGSSGKVNENSANWDCNSAMASKASVKGLATPIASAFSAKALWTSSETVSGLNTFWSIEFTSTPESLSKELYKPSSDIFNNHD